MGSDEASSPDVDTTAAVVGEELWTTGQIAAYLAEWGFTRKLVAAMVTSGEFPGVKRRPRAWARVPSRIVMAYAETLGPPPSGEVHRNPRARIGRGDSP